MTKKVVLAALLAICPALAQTAVNGSRTFIGNLRVKYPNAVTTGTALNRLAKLTGSPASAVQSSAGDTSEAVGIVVAGDGTSGDAEIAFAGKAPCEFDGATTAGNYVQISATLAGACHDSGAATLPASGQVLGRVTTTSAAAGVYEVDLTARTNYPAAPSLTTLTGSLRVAYPNNSSSGTILNRLAKLTGAPSTAVTVAVSDTTGATGIVVAGAGTTGTADIAFTGKASCMFDGATTAGNYIQISATLAGACHDSGAATLPASGQVLGRVTTTNAAAGVYEVDLTARTNYPAAPTLTTLTGSLRVAYPNEASSGTTLNRLAKLTGAPSTAVTLATSDTTGAVGIVVAGGGTAGTADIAFTGKASCAFDGATTAGNYVQVSVTLAGACHDAGPGVPGSGQIIGRVTTTNGTGGTYEVDLTTGQLSAGSAPGGATVAVSKIWLPVAGCQNTTAFLLWDTPTVNPAVAACVTGSNVQKGIAEFADGANSLSLQITLALPSDFTGAIDARFKWTTLATTGSVVWQIATACVADGETDDPAFNPPSAASDAAKGTALQTNDAAVAGITATGCTAGELMHVRVFRDPAHISDDLTATARLIGVELTTRRTL